MHAWPVAASPPARQSLASAGAARGSLLRSPAGPATSGTRRCTLFGRVPDEDHRVRRFRDVRNGQQLVSAECFDELLRLLNCRFPGNRSDDFAGCFHAPILPAVQRQHEPRREQAYDYAMRDLGSAGGAGPDEPLGTERPASSSEGASRQEEPAEAAIINDISAAGARDESKQMDAMCCPAAGYCDEPAPALAAAGANNSAVFSEDPPVPLAHLRPERPTQHSPGQAAQAAPPWVTDSPIDSPGGATGSSRGREPTDREAFVRTKPRRGGTCGLKGRPNKAQGNRRSRAALGCALPQAIDSPGRATQTRPRLRLEYGRT